jgi:flagellar FliL protein
MADEDKTMMEVEETETPSASKSSSPIRKYGIYGAIVLAMILAAYFITLKVVKPMIAGGGPVTEQSEEKKEKAKPKKKEKEHAPKRDHGSHGSSQGSAAGDIYMIDQIIVNPAGTGGRRFLSTSIGFELETGEAGDLLNEREAIVRDALITILSSQSVPELSDFKQREKLRKLIRLRVSKLLQTEDIAAVYFTEFILQ